MHTTAEAQASEVTLLVCVDPASRVLAGEVLGPAGVTPFQDRTELIAALGEATDSLSPPAW